MKQKNHAWLISLLVLLGLLTSCGGEIDVTADTTASGVAVDTAVESAEILNEAAIPEMPAKDLGGYKLALGHQPQDKIAWSTISFAVGEENGEVLNDSIYRRNGYLTEKYNFALEDIEFSEPDSELMKQILAGDTTCAAYLIQLNKVGALSREDTLVEFHSIENIDLSGNWWDQDMLRDLKLGGKQYFMNGDIIFSVYDCLRVIMYCKELADDLGFSGFYEMVDEGEWTHDKMIQMAESASDDLNGDGVYDYNDRFGVLFNNESVSAHISSQNIKVVDNEGNIGVFTDKFMSAYTNILRLLKRECSFNYNTDKYPNLTAREAIVSMFDNKQCLFFENGISAAAQYMRNVESVDYGFLPFPKFNEEQDKYYSFVSTSAPVLCVPITTGGDELANLGFVFEALCRESSKTCVPTYFETCFSAKYTHDEKSYDMILLATQSRIYDVGIIYNLGGAATTIQKAAVAHDDAITSKLESIRTSISEAYKDKVKGE